MLFALTLDGQLGSVGSTRPQEWMMRPPVLTRHCGRRLAIGLAVTVFGAASPARSACGQ
jgi:hypothetical protein